MGTILVTGGAGAIGSNVCRQLMAQGHRVVVLDDLSSGHDTLVPPGAVLIRGSVSSDEAIEAAFSHRPQRVIHLAALFANQNSVDHPDQDLIVNGLGTLKIFMRAQRAGVEKVVYVSSSCVYGKQDRLDESTEIFRPETPYGITKLLGEQYAHFWSEFHGTPIVTVRPFNSYGPGELPGRYRNVIPNFLWRAMQGQPLVITGTGEETRDFTYVTDTAQGMVRALFADTGPGEVFNIASGRATSIRQLAEMVNQLTGNRAGIELKPRRDWDGISHRLGAIDRARARLGYAPEVSISEGLERTYEWLKENAAKAAATFI